MRLYRQRNGQRQQRVCALFLAVAVGRPRGRSVHVLRHGSGPRRQPGGPRGRRVLRRYAATDVQRHPLPRWRAARRFPGRFPRQRRPRWPGDRRGPVQVCPADKSFSSLFQPLHSLFLLAIEDINGLVSSGVGKPGAPSCSFKVMPSSRQELV